jgi:hypothetical protein
MKICWDNLEKIKLNSKGFFVNEKCQNPMIEIESCKSCGESFLAFIQQIKKGKGEYCSKECSAPIYGKLHKYHTEETKIRIGFSSKERYKNKENHPLYGKRGKYSPCWKGGVTKNNIPLYDTYAHQIKYTEEVRRNKDNERILEVKCNYCGKWYIPKRRYIVKRIECLEGNRKGDSNLYCSDKCKELCPIFRRRLYQIGHPKLEEIERPYQQEWSEEVKKNANFQCEICGSKDDLISHHILPVKIRPELQADIDNGICLCESCHMIHGHKDECSTGNLARMVCL